MEELLELEADIDIMLRTLKVPFRQRVVVKNVSTQFVSEEFGVVVSAINRTDYSFVLRALNEELPGYRYVFIAPNDNMVEAKDDDPEYGQHDGASQTGPCRLHRQVQRVFHRRKPQPR